MKPPDDQPQPPPQFDQRAGSNESPDLMAHADPMPPKPPEIPERSPPIEIKPLLPEGEVEGEVPIAIPPAPAQPPPVQPIEPAPDKSAPPKPFDQYDPTTKPADLPKSPMPYDPFDRSTFSYGDKARAQDRTNRSVFEMMNEVVARMFWLEKQLEVVMKQHRDIWPPRLPPDADDASVDPVKELTGSGLEADLHTWARTVDKTAVAESPLVRTYLDADGTLYGFHRRDVFDSLGGAWTFAEETRYIIAVIPTECEDAVIDIDPSYDDALTAINPYTMAVVADVAYDNVEAVTNIYVDSVDAVTGVAADDVDAATNIYYGAVDVVTNVAYSDASFVTDVAYDDVQVLSDISIAITCNDDGTISAEVTPTYATVSKITSISYANASLISSISYASASHITSVSYASASHITSVETASVSKITSISYADASHVTSISYANAVWSIGYTAATFVTALDLTKDGFLKCPAAPPEPPP